MWLWNRAGQVGRRPGCAREHDGRASGVPVRPVGRRVDCLEIRQRHEGLSDGDSLMPQVLFRAIKARPANWQAFYDEIAKTMDAEVAPQLTSYFERVTESWINQPNLHPSSGSRDRSATVDVFPIGANANIWQYVSKGHWPILDCSQGSMAIRFASNGAAKAVTNRARRRAEDTEARKVVRGKTGSFHAGQSSRQQGAQL